MVYESSYESGRLPFRPDTTRGHWAEPSDFIYLCLGLAFKLDFFFVPMEDIINMGITAFIPYLICIALYVVPIMVIHSFMGQFSSSAFISAFRMSPLFKGMGYISLAMNLVILMYYSIFATIPLLFIFDSFRPTLPWSCEALEQDLKWNVTTRQKHIMCNATDTEITNSTDVENDYDMLYELPAVEYFKSKVNFQDYGYDGVPNITFSWSLFGCTVVVWSLIAGVFYKFASAAELGKLLRYAIWGTLAALLICIIRFMFLPGAVASLSHYVTPNKYFIAPGIGNVLVYTMYAFGPGWGSIISLSSCNKFNTNIMRDSWIISIGQMLIFLSFNFATMLIDWHFSKTIGGSYFSYVSDHWDTYLSTASAIANMSFANLWCIIFYGMLLSAALIVMITQLYSILLAIFDEFEFLREYKTRVTFISISVLAFCSIYLCTNHGVTNFSALSVDTLFTQTSLHLLLLLVVLWIYGRERFQRDIEFMLGQRFATWKVNVLRFLVPICLFFMLMFAMFNAIFEHMFSSSFIVDLVAILFILLPWLAIPGYGFFILRQATGSWWVRIRRACRPTDWYPVEKEDRQRYEEAMGNENITHQLNPGGEENL